MKQSSLPVCLFSACWPAWVPLFSQHRIAARQAELLYLLKHDCGSCHGMTRKGGLGPPLLPESLNDKPQQLMVITVLDGRPGTPMPPWRGELTEQDAQWLVEAMRSGEGL